MIKRSERGWRCGDSHHNSRYSDAMVKRARDLFELESVKPTAIVYRLRIEFGAMVPVKTIHQWIYYTSRNVTPRAPEHRAPR